MPVTEVTPLGVNLDGTLSRVDTLHEQLPRALGSWRKVLGLLRHTVNGPAGLKHYLARTVPFAPERLPYHERRTALNSVHHIATVAASQQ